MDRLYKSEVEQIAQQLHFEHERILVTGASGLIGTMLVDALMAYNNLFAKNVQIYAMARNLEELENRLGHYDSEKIHLIQGDISLGIPRDDDYDIIFHLASNADPKSYASFPAETITTNLMGIYHILEYARERNTTKVFFASTMEVYGDIGECGKKISEEQYGLVNFNCLRQGYAESKRTAELMCKSYAIEYGVSCWVGRFGYIYGASRRSDDSKVIFQFMNNALDGKDIVMKSEGLQKRTYCYCMDAVLAMIYILYYGKVGDCYNIADDDVIASIKEIALMIAQINKVSVVQEKVTEEETKGFSQPIDMLLSSSKLRKLGWSPTVHLQEGIERTMRILGEI